LRTDGWCAKRLKDASLSTEEMNEAYLTIVVDMRRMYHECNLVHGDLSEYNLLWHNGRAVIIDVSQSVEHAHPYANDFLRKDITNITDFFKKRGVNVLTAYRLFQFITLDHLPGNLNTDAGTDVQQSLRSLLIEIIEGGAVSLGDLSDSNAVVNDSDSEAHDEIEERRLIDEAVFLQSYIPRSLHEFSNPVAEMNRIAKGGRERVHTDAIRSMLGGKIGIKSTKEVDTEDSNDGQFHSAGGDEENDYDDDDDEGDDDEDDEGSTGSSSGGAGELDEDGTPKKYHRCLPGRNDPEARAFEKEQRKEARRLVKQQAAEKRKVKIPKHIKKRAIKGGNKSTR